MKLSLDNILIRTTPKAGDLGYITYLHGVLYSKEYNFGNQFENYVAKGLMEFYAQYNSARSRTWVCEHNHKIIGFLALMDRGESAQLRYFIIEPAYRGIGLGKKLMELFIEFLAGCQYKSSYLWTTSELDAAISLYKRHGFQLTEEKLSADFGKSLYEQRYELNL